MIDYPPEILPPRWCERLRRMRRDDPVYKPAALLAVLDVIESGVTPESVPIAACAERFDAILAAAGLLAGRGARHAFMPVYHLSTTLAPTGRVPFWDLLRGGVPRDAFALPSSLHGLLREVDTLAVLPTLRTDLGSADDRERVRWAIYSLLEEDDRPDSHQLLRAHDPNLLSVEQRRERLRERTADEFVLDEPSADWKMSLREHLVRDRALRTEVLAAYDEACALCSLRLRWNHLIEAEAAHIKPRHVFGVDDVRNALALCRTHHWAFDHGLWCATPNLVVRVREEGSIHTGNLSALKDFDGHRLNSPTQLAARPHPAALDWHQTYIFSRSYGVGA